MKSLKFVFVFILVSLAIFYIAAMLINATADLSKMGESRVVIFGIWLAIIVFGCMAHFMNEEVKNSDK